MFESNSFYKSSRMSPYARPKRAAAAASASESPAAPGTTSPAKKQKTVRRVTSLNVATESRRSPRIAAKVQVRAHRMPLGKENVGTTGKKNVATMERSIKTEEEMEEEDDDDMIDVKPLKEEPTSDESDDEEKGFGLSAYEKRRLENISKNAEFFASLDIFQAKENLAVLSPQMQRAKVQPRGLKREKTRASDSYLPRRAPSLRLQNKNPEGTQLPEKFKEPPLYSLYLPQPSEHERLSSEPIKMDATNVKTKEEMTNAGEDFVKGLSKLTKGVKTKVEVDNTDLDRFAKKLQKMKMKETYVAKVTRDRIFSVTIHPSTEKSIVCAGDKWGKIGLWDVNSTEGDDGVFLFAPHARPVNFLKFAPQNASLLYSVSYDGTVRCGDLNKEVFNQVYATDEEEDIWTSYFDFLSPDASSLLVTENTRSGYVSVVDTRSSGQNAEQTYMVHSKRVKTVSVHPTMPQYFVTASTDTTAALWDIRNMKQKGLNKPIALMSHHKSVSSAFFSPLTGSKILTTGLDDKLGVFDTSSAKNGGLDGVEKSMWMSHNNWTGRWLTPFRAIWHPRREDAFIIGSMCQPRRIEVFSTRGKMVHMFQDEFLGSVCSINAFHPTRDFIAGGNSSGKVHVLMS